MSQGNYCGFGSFIWHEGGGALGDSRIFENLVVGFLSFLIVQRTKFVLELGGQYMLDTGLVS